MEYFNICLSNAVMMMVNVCILSHYKCNIFKFKDNLHFHCVYEIVHFEGCHKKASVVVNFVVCINCASLA